MKQALECVSGMQDILPLELEEQYGFVPYAQAVQTMHFPLTKEGFVQARERFVFEEFLVFILTLRRMIHSESRAA